MNGRTTAAAPRIGPGPSVDTEEGIVMVNRVMRVVGGLVAGLVFGIGLAVMLVLYGKAALGTKAPWLAVLIGLAVGAVLGAIPPRRRPS